IIWSGNIPEETGWFVVRSRGGWQLLATALIALHFALPFLLLLPRFTNSRRSIVAGIAAFMLVMRFVDVYWLIAPAQEAQPWPPPWPALLARLGIGGVWLAWWLWRLEPPLPAAPAALAVQETH